MTIARRVLTGILLLLLPLGGYAQSAPTAVRAAVAANFRLTLERLAAAHLKDGGTPLRISSGATGALYGQIVQGAPFDVFFAADRERPAELEANGLIVPGSRFTYAIGRLVAWRPGTPWQGTLERTLKDPAIRVVAIANPELAPYGQAAREVLTRLKLWGSPPFRIVQGESLGQTFQFASTGNAQLGFVALAQIREAPEAERVRWERESLIIDPGLHAPIEQDAVILRAAQGRAEVQRFMAFVRSPAGRAIIAAAGYDTRP